MMTQAATEPACLAVPQGELVPVLMFNYALLLSLRMQSSRLFMLT